MQYCSDGGPTWGVLRRVSIRPITVGFRKSRSCGSLVGSSLSPLIGAVAANAQRTPATGGTVNVNECWDVNSTSSFSKFVSIAVQAFGIPIRAGTPPLRSRTRNFKSKSGTRIIHLNRSVGTYRQLCSFSPHGLSQRTRTTIQRRQMGTTVNCRFADSRHLARLRHVWRSTILHENFSERAVAGTFGSPGYAQAGTSTWTVKAPVTATKTRPGAEDGSVGLPRLTRNY
jgi:hypothetical protein